MMIFRGRWRWCIALGVLGFTPWGWAVWPNYSPIVLGRPVRVFAHIVLTMRSWWIDSNNLGIDFHRPGEAAPCLKIRWGDEREPSRLEQIGPGGEVVGSAPIEGSALTDAEASAADLNGDGRADYIVVTHSGGNGLAGQITYVYFLLSSPSGWVARSVFSFDAAPVDLVDLNGDGRPEFVHGMCVHGEKGRDARNHNYWVYNLVGFSGTALVSANAASPEFPKWVMYTSRPNHDDSDLLTAAQRERSWLATWAEEQRRAKEPLFPNLTDFAREQGRSLRKP